MGDKKYLAVNNDGWNVMEESEGWLDMGEEQQGEGRLM